MKKIMSRIAGFLPDRQAGAFGGKNLIKSLILGGFILAVAAFATPALAYGPNLSLSGSGNNVTLSISGAQSNSQIYIYYTLPGSNLPQMVTSQYWITDYSGGFTTSLNGISNGINTGAQVYVTVAGQQSNTATYGSSGGGCGYYGCGNNCGYYGCNNGSLSLSQTSLNLNVGQSVMVTANNSGYNYGNLYISSNSNSGVASASVNSNQITVYGSTSGSTTISICQNNNSSCASLYVTVGSGSCGYYGCGSVLSLSQTSLSLTTSQTASVSIYGSSSYYISNNSNSSVVSASISGSTINLYALTSGNSTLTICANSSSQCVSLYVTVTGSVLGSSNYAVSVRDDYYSPQTITIPVGSSVTWHNDGSMAHTVTFDSPYSDSGNLYTGASYTQTFSTAGTYYYHCRFHSGMTGTIFVTGSGSGGNGNLWFSPSSSTMYTGQSLAVSINSSVSSTSNYYTSNTYYVSSNSNSNVVSASISGTVLNLYANQSGSASISVCHSSLNFCGTIYVTVNGGGNSGSSLSLSQTSLNLNFGQSSSVNISGNGSYYISSNSNSGVASASISGSVLNIYASSSGNTTISVCQSYGSSGCASVYVTVGSYYYNGGNNYGNNYYGGSYYGGGLQYPGGSVAGASAYANGQLIAEGPTVYIVYKNSKSAFGNSQAFLGLGFNFSNVLQVGSSGLQNSGFVITNWATQHPWGTWIKSGNTIYFVHQSGLIPLPDWNTFVNNGGQSNLVVNANNYDFRLPILSAMSNYDSRLY